MEIGTYEQIVTLLEKELELNGLGAPDELQINTVSQHVTNTNADRPQSSCHHCKKPGRYRNQCPLLNKKEQVEGTKTNPGNKNSGANNSIPDNNKNNNKNNENSNIAERKPKTIYPRCEVFGKTNQSTENCYVRAISANRLLPWKSKPEGQSGHHQQDAQYSITDCVRATARNATSSLRKCE